MKRFIIVGVILLVSGFATYGCRSHREETAEKRMEKHAEWFVEKITDELDLNADQQKTLNTIKSEVVAKQSEMKSLREGVMNDVFAILDKESVNEDELNAMFTEREAKLKELRQFAVAKYAQFHNSLTKEQKTKLKEKLEKFKKYRG